MNRIDANERYATAAKKAIKRVRNQLGLSQADFGESIGVTQVEVSKWESGKNVAEMPVFIQIMQVHGLGIRVVSQPVEEAGIFFE